MFSFESINELLRSANWSVISIMLALVACFYLLFRFVFTENNPESERKNDIAKRDNTVSEELVYEILKSLGNKENIVYIKAAVPYLYVEVNDIKNVDKDKLLHLGASALLITHTSVQATFGTNSGILCERIQKIIDEQALIPTDDETKEQTLNTENEITNPTQDNIPITIISPLEGKLLPLTDVPDQMFSNKIMGDGFAIEPSKGVVISPFDGKVLNIFPTKHAICLIADDGTEILIHFGINTDKLDGLGFKLFVKSGDIVKQGDKLLEVNLSYILDNATSIITPIIFTNGQTVTLNKLGNVNLGEAGIITIN